MPSEKLHLMAKEKNLLGSSVELAKLIATPSSTESLFRDDHYDLKRQHLGPSFVNTQRLYELADSALYQAGYGAPAAIAGGLMGGPPGAVLGFGVGSKLGAGHAYWQEAARLQEAKNTFRKTEKQLLNKLNASFGNWATVSAVLGGLGGAGLGYGLADGPPSSFNRIAAATLLGLGGAGTVGLLGGLFGRSLTREKLRANPKLAPTIKLYD